MNKSDSVRVRFAPSPTGYLHVGGLRTALFNYLFARHHNGKFILRIEDTDRARQIPGAVDNLIDTLKQMGLDYDEGPFFQSQRLDIYRKYANELVEKGSAYYCFCTLERLEEVRQLQRSRGLQTQYDRFCRSLSQSEIKEKLNQNIPHVIRLRVPLDTEIKFNDIIRGTVKIETNNVDDQVLLKSDGYPTYHLANVIDDHLMNITHIIRGEEWLTSVPKHILLYQAFVWEVPQLAHVPLILNPNKTKLSKRQGDVATEDFLSKGYLPEALINFIALLGWNPGEGDNREIFSKEELIKLFTLEKIHPSGAVFNIEKLDWMNSQYIKNYDIDKLTEMALPYLNKSGCNTDDKEKNKRIISALRTYIHKLEEIPEQAKIYCKKIDLTSAQLEIIRSDSSRKVFSLLLKKLDGINELIPENVKESLTALQTETGIKGKPLFQPVRLVLTGEDHGPELGLIAYVLGKTETYKRLKAFV
jgi:nondiscriminating glutamyl-tRNA synthetase